MDRDVVLRRVESQGASGGGVAGWLSANPLVVQQPEVPPEATDVPAAKMASEPVTPAKKPRTSNKKAEPRSKKAQPAKKKVQPGNKKVQPGTQPGNKKNAAAAPKSSAAKPSVPRVIVVPLAPLPAAPEEPGPEPVVADSRAEKQSAEPIVAVSEATKEIAEPVGSANPGAEAAEDSRTFVPWQKTAEPLGGEQDARASRMPIGRRPTLAKPPVGRRKVVALLAAAAAVAGLLLWQWDPGSTSAPTSVTARGAVEPATSSPTPDAEETQSAEPTEEAEEEESSAESPDPTDEPLADPEASLSEQAAESGTLGQSRTDVRRQGSARDALNPEQVAAVRAAVSTALARLRAEKASTVAGSPQAALLAQQEAILRQFASRYDLTLP